MRAKPQCCPKQEGVGYIGLWKERQGERPVFHLGPDSKNDMGHHHQAGIQAYRLNDPTDRAGFAQTAVRGHPHHGRRGQYQHPQAKGKSETDRQRQASRQVGHGIATEHSSQDHRPGALRTQNQDGQQKAARWPYGGEPFRLDNKKLVLCQVESIG